MVALKHNAATVAATSAAITSDYAAPSTTAAAAPCGLDRAALRLQAIVGKGQSRGHLIVFILWLKPRNVSTGIQRCPRTAKASETREHQLLLMALIGAK